MGGQQVSSSFASPTEMRLRAVEEPQQLLTRPVEQVPGAREPLSRPVLLWRGSGLRLRDTAPRLTQASLGHFTYRRAVRSGQIEGRPLRATIRDATLHRISLTIVNGRAQPAQVRAESEWQDRTPSRRASGLRGEEPPPTHRPGSVMAAGRCFLGSFATTAAYEASIASRTSSSGIAPPTRNVFHPDRPM